MFRRTSNAPACSIPNGNNGFNVEHFRDFNNAGPTVAVGFETQPGHQASNNRGEYRASFCGAGCDSVGVTTFGGTGIYGAKIGGVWDALLGEGRNWFFYASSDWHNRGQFSIYETGSTNDFYPGEYQKLYIPRPDCRRPVRAAGRRRRGPLRQLLLGHGRPDHRRTHLQGRSDR